MLRQQRDDKIDAAYAGVTDEKLACEAYAVVDNILQGYHQQPLDFGIDAPCPAAVDPRRAYRE